MKLDELHVLQRQAGAQHHGVAVAGASVGGSCGEIGAAIAAGRENSAMGAETMERAVFEAQRHHAAALAVLNDEVEGEIFDEEFCRIAQRLAIERMQHG